MIESSTDELIFLFMMLNGELLGELLGEFLVELIDELIDEFVVNGSSSNKNGISIVTGDLATSGAVS